MPEYRQYYDFEIQGHSLSQGHCKNSAGISTSIRLLPLHSTASVLVLLWRRNIEEISSCVWFDWRMAQVVAKVWYGYTQLLDNCSVPTVRCCCQEAKTETSYRYKVASSYGKQLLKPGILGFMDKGEGMGWYFAWLWFLLRGGSKITSSRAYTISNETSVLTRLRRCEIVEKNCW